MLVQKFPSCGHSHKTSGLAITLIGIGPTKVEEAARDNAKPPTAEVPKLASAAGNQGGQQKIMCPECC